MALNRFEPERLEKEYEEGSISILCIFSCGDSAEETVTLVSAFILGFERDETIIVALPSPLAFRFTVFLNKETETIESSEEETTRSFSKVSEGKRFMLILDVSPATRRSVDEESVIASKAPSTTRGKLFQTESL